uniref:Lipoprotein n=1 Tax=Nonomuraea gerenzanensis TaxID=93944 RepID=A0A1M4E0T0_9ACTN|nr:lipoprotein [Nonomuraea gerenzanensis]
MDLAADEVHAAQSFPFTGADLKIDVPLGGVRVLQGTGGAVQVERWVRGKAADSPAWSLRDGTLRLSASCNLVFGDCGARYHVKVPPGVRLSIDVTDGLILNGLTQDVAASSRDRIQVTGASGRLRLRSDGSITGEGLKSGYVRCRTSDGAIDVAFAAAPATLDLRSGDGRVTARVPSGRYAVTVASTDGSTRSEVEHDRKSERRITAGSKTGDVRILTK